MTQPDLQNHYKVQRVKFGLMYEFCIGQKFNIQPININKGVYSRCNKSNLFFPTPRRICTSKGLTSSQHLAPTFFKEALAVS